MSMNVWTGVGRLVADPRSGSTQNGNPWTSFRIAVDNEFAKEDAPNKTLFINISCFGKTAEFVSKYITKGRLVAVSGRLEENSYEKEDKVVHGVQLIANTVQSLERPSESDSSQQVNSKPSRNDTVPF